jgi:hypothetical protein
MIYQFASGEIGVRVGHKPYEHDGKLKCHAVVFADSMSALLDRKLNIRETSVTIQDGENVSESLSEGQRHNFIAILSRELLFASHWLQLKKMLRDH